MLWTANKPDFHQKCFPHVWNPQLAFIISAKQSETKQDLIFQEMGQSGPVERLLKRKIVHIRFHSLGNKLSFFLLLEPIRYETLKIWTIQLVGVPM